MKLLLVVVSALLLNGGCENKSHPEHSIILKSADNPGTTPDHFVLSIRNDSQEYFCFSKSEMDPPSGAIQVIPASGTVSSGPAPDVSLGIDINGGLWVVPPQSEKKIFIPVDRADRGERQIKGIVRSVVCEDMFESTNAKVLEQKIQFNFTD